MGKNKIRKIKPSKVKFSKKEVKRQWPLLVWSVFFFLYGLLFNYIPLAGWTMAFQNYKPKTGIFHSKWIGLDKFKFLFSDVTFLRDIRNTLAMGILNITCSFVMAILFAILLNELKSKGGKRVVQTISYLPHFLSWIIVTGILHDALSASGIVNELLGNLGIGTINFFAEPKYFWGIVAFANVWKETGWNAIIYLAAILAISPTSYEAAKIDGASKIQQIRYVTLPGMAPTLSIMLIMRVGHALNIGYEKVMLLYTDSSYETADVISTYITRLRADGSDAALSKGIAADLMNSVIAMALVLGANAISRKVSDTSLF